MHLKVTLGTAAAPAPRQRHHPDHERHGRDMTSTAHRRARSYRFLRILPMGPRFDRSRTRPTLTRPATSGQHPPASVNAALMPCRRAIASRHRPGPSRVLRTKPITALRSRGPAAGPELRNPRSAGTSRRADEGTRTLGLLHGKRDLNRSDDQFLPANEALPRFVSFALVAADSRGFRGVLRTSSERNGLHCFTLKRHARPRSMRSPVATWRPRAGRLDRADPCRAGFEFARHGVQAAS